MCVCVCVYRRGRHSGSGPRDEGPKQTHPEDMIQNKRDEMFNVSLGVMSEVFTKTVAMQNAHLEKMVDYRNVKTN